MTKLYQFLLVVICLFVLNNGLSQKTKVSGVVTDKETNEPLPFVKVYFQDTKSATISDSIGYYVIETFFGYKDEVKAVKVDK